MIHGALGVSEGTAPSPVWLPRRGEGPCAIESGPENVRWLTQKGQISDVMRHSGMRPARDS
jgi:hypothetical protein